MITPKEKLTFPGQLPCDTSFVLELRYTLLGLGVLQYFVSWVFLPHLSLRLQKLALSVILALGTSGSQCGFLFDGVASLEASLMQTANSGVCLSAWLYDR